MTTACCTIQRFCQGDELRSPFIPSPGLALRLEAVYEKWNRRDYVHPDPLEFLYDYPDVLDREVVAFVASSLAYGRVKQILRSVSTVLGRMGPSPRAFLLQNTSDALQMAFGDFRHRFTSGEELASMMAGLRAVIHRYGSLQACFASRMRAADPTVLQALCGFVGELKMELKGERSALFPSPSDASACKRLNLFLRWMVRNDEVDPGGWEGVPPSKLIVPLDTHMHRIGLALGMTRRRQADMRTALEVTAGFRSIAPDDPVRYDFVLTRPGIWGDPELRFLEPHER